MCRVTKRESERPELFVSAEQEASQTGGETRGVGVHGCVRLSSAFGGLFLLFIRKVLRLLGFLYRASYSVKQAIQSKACYACTHIRVRARVSGVVLPLPSVGCHLRSAFTRGVLHCTSRSVPCAGTLPSLLHCYAQCA